MYEYDNHRGCFTNIKMTIQKSIRIDSKTEEIINSMDGNNFSQKIRALTREYVRMCEAYDTLLQRNTKFGQKM